ncbi:CGNR zinc finger domain-containing protein [Candidatus Bipolaricaulota bacterium]
MSADPCGGHGATTISEINPIAGHIALEFVNALVDYRFEGISPAEGYETLVCWSRHSSILCPSALDYVNAESAEQQAEAESVFLRAQTLRQVLFNIFSHEAQGESADPRDIAVLNEELAAALCRRRLKRRDGRYFWASRGGDIALDVMLWPIVYEAAELLVSDDLRWVRECQGQDCRRLFLDTSRGRNRRWCDMGACGNRAKARRNYEKKRSDEKPR